MDGVSGPAVLARLLPAHADDSHLHLLAQMPSFHSVRYLARGAGGALALPRAR